MESEAKGPEGAKEEHRKSVSGSVGSGPTELPSVGAIGSSTRNVVLPSSEHLQSMHSPMGSSTRSLTVPSHELNPLLTVGSGSNQRDVGMPSSQRLQSIPGSRETIMRSLVVPSVESRPSPSLATESSRGGLVTPSEQHIWLTPPTGASMNVLAVPSSEQPPSASSSTTSSITGSDRVSLDPRKSAVSGAGSHTTGLSVRKGEPRKSVVHPKIAPAKEAEAKVQRHQWKLTRPLVVVSALTSFGSSFQYGFFLWIVNHPVPFNQNFFNSTTNLKKKIIVDKEFLGVLYNLTIAIFSFGGIIGCLVFSPMADKFGRRGSLFLNNIFSIMCSFLMGLVPTIYAFEFSIFARLLTGICAGIFSCLVPVYLAELAPKTARGTIVMMTIIFIIAGHMASQILGLPKLLGNKKDWPFLLSIPGGLALFQIIILPFFPESPRYLLIQRRKEENARKALQKLRCQEDVEDEIVELYLEDQAEKPEKTMSAMRLLCYRGLRWQILSTIVLAVGQQLSGVNAAFYFSERIYTSMALKQHQIRYLHMFSSILILVASLVVTYVIDTLGRRVLVLIGFGCCSILCVLITMTLELQNTIQWMSFISSSFIFLFLLGHIIGPGTTPSVLITEIFLQSSRSTGCALSGFINWLLRFISRMLFDQIETKIGFYIFLVFWPFCFGTFFYIFKIIPETKGKSFLEIQKLMSVHVAVTRKIQVQSVVLNDKQNKPDKKKKTTHSGKKKKKRKSAPDLT